MTAFPPYLRPVCFPQSSIIGRLAVSCVLFCFFTLWACMVGEFSWGCVHFSLETLSFVLISIWGFIPLGALHFHRLWIPSPVKRVLSHPCASRSPCHPILLQQPFTFTAIRKQKTRITAQIGSLQIWVLMGMLSILWLMRGVGAGRPTKMLLCMAPRSCVLPGLLFWGLQYWNVFLSSFDCSWWIFSRTCFCFFPHYFTAMRQVHSSTLIQKMDFFFFLIWKRLYSIYSRSPDLFRL